jgi:hypothetical protein
MKILANRYSFSPSTKQVFLSGFTTNIALEQLLLITNSSRNTIIYNFADPAAGGVISNNVITLSANTTSMLSTDRLQIFLDDLFEPIFGVYQDSTSYSPVTSVSAVPSLTGVNAPLTIDIQTGGALALQGDLDKDIDSVTTFDAGYASISNFLSAQTLGTVFSGTGVQVLSANANRITMFGQNLGATPLFVKYGLGCNISSFNLILYPGTAAGDGRGEKFSDDRYKGDVSVNTTTGLSAQYIFWEGV